ncbi:MAG: FAD-dependent oxidoreductase [Proteobacteria bacterium]|nr:FAD-dependent oxidoreductase [Pseudomonadota bacterium]
MAANQTYVIIGASAAGLSAACAIVKTEPEAKVTVLSEETDSPYFRPMIPFIISGEKSPADVAMTGQGPYQAKGIDLRLNTRVVSLDTHSNQVKTKSGDTVLFDRLLIASGSSPYIPRDIEGTGIKGVYALRTLAQARDAAQRSSSARHAILLGGGLLNLKAAFALLEKKVAVTLVVYSPEILSQLMEPDDAVMIRQALEHAGLKIMTGRSAKTIVQGPNGVKAVILDNGVDIPCDMVFIGKGVRPCVDFLKSSDMEIDQGVVVDPYTRTSRENIFAAGDVAVTFDPVTGNRVVTGLWTNAAEMGLCAGKNMAGDPTAYAGTFGVMNATQVAGLPFVSMGQVHPGSGDYEVHRNVSGNAYRKLVFSKEGKHLVGLVMVGDITHAGLYRYIMREQRDIRRVKEKIIGQTLTSAHLMYG